MIGGEFAAAVMAASIAAKNNKNAGSKEEVETAASKKAGYKPEGMTSYYICERCPAKFNRRYNRDRHVEMVHKIPKPEKPTKIADSDVIEHVPLKRTLSVGVLTTSPDLQSTTTKPEPKKIKLNLVEATTPVESDASVVDEEEHEKTDVNRKCKNQEEKHEKTDVKTEEDKDVNVILFPLKKEVTITVFVNAK